MLTTRHWWLLVVIAVLIVIAWPPHDDKSLALKFVNWAADPWNQLPVLPPQLSFRLGDDPQAVYDRQFHDRLLVNAPG